MSKPIRSKRYGAWLLEPLKVARLTPREPRWLRAGHGRLWVTLSALPGDQGVAATDHILLPGDRVMVRPGQTAVISVSGPKGSSASFDWNLVNLPRPMAPWRRAMVEFFAGMAQGAAARA